MSSEPSEPVVSPVPDVSNVVERERSFGIGRLCMFHFRNYRELDLTLEPAFTILAGPNAQGKTNFLEAIYLLSTTRLLRSHRDHEAILAGEDKCRVSADLLTGTEVAITLEHGHRKKAWLNGQGLPRAADLMGRLPSVAITIQDLEIVRGEPADRRLFLDLELSGLYPGYLRHFSLYKRALEQRNALLRNAQERAKSGFSVDAWAFEAWEEQLAEHGAAMRQFRRDYLGRLQEPATSTHAFMSGVSERLEVRYEPKDEAADALALRLLLEETRDRDLHRGSTSVGPHRDDVAIEIQGKEARLFGSQGQQRTAVIAIKMATLTLAREILGAPPVLLLDDILSDLDPVRRACLCELVLDQASQAVLTCTEAEAAGATILSRARVYRVSAGSVSVG